MKGSGSGRWASVDFLCPFGGLETLYSLLAGDGFLRHTAASSVILLVGMLVMAVAYRRSFCGTICPLGTLQGIFGAAGRRLLRRRFTIPRAVDRVARYLKYAVLVFFALWTWQAAELVLRPYDPWVAWAHLTSPQLLTGYGIGLAVLDRLPRRLRDLRPLLLQVPLPHRRIAGAAVPGQLPEHPPGRGRLHRLRPLRQGLHDERRGGDRRRRQEAPSASPATSASTRARCPAPSRSRRPAALARPRSPPPAWSWR